MKLQKCAYIKTCVSVTRVFRLEKVARRTDEAEHH